MILIIMYLNTINTLIFNQTNFVKISVSELIMLEMTNNPFFNDHRKFCINNGYIRNQTNDSQHVFIKGISKNLDLIGIQTGHYNIKLLGLLNDEIILNKYHTPKKTSVLFLKHKDQLLMVGVDNYVNSVNIVHESWLNGYNKNLASRKFNAFVFEYNIKMQNLHNNLIKIGITEKNTRNDIIKIMVEDKTPNPYPLKKSKYIQTQ